MPLLAAWSGVNTALVVLAVIILIVLIVLMSSRKPGPESPGDLDLPDAPGREEQAEVEEPDAGQGGA
jgi:hypothetical protein